jgi:hypothetical protein
MPLNEREGNPTILTDCQDLLGLYPEPVTGVQMTRNEWDSALAGALPFFLGGLLTISLAASWGFRE